MLVPQAIFLGNFYAAVTRNPAEPILQNYVEATLGCNNDVLFKIDFQNLVICQYPNYRLL